MACDLCRAFPVRTIRNLDADIESGEKSVDELSEAYYMSAALIEEHMNRCVRPRPSTGHELLDTLLREIRETAEERKDSYDENPEANAHAMTHYVNLMREARELVMAMERIRPSDELAKEIATKVLNPIIRQCVVISVEEITRLREEFVAILGADQFQHIDRAVKRSLRRIATRLKGDTAETIDLLPIILAPDGKRPKDSPSISAELAADPIDPPKIN